MPSTTPPAISNSAGDPYPWWTAPHNQERADSNPLYGDNSNELIDIRKRLTRLENMLLHEQKIREENPFVQELYDQYKVGLALLEDPDE